MIRKTAAQQIGEVVREYPHTLQTLLERCRKYLYNKDWDTRIAAGETIEYIAQNVPPWNPPTISELFSKYNKSQHLNDKINSFVIKLKDLKFFFLFLSFQKSILTCLWIPNLFISHHLIHHNDPVTFLHSIHLICCLF
jgi:hypothetical protein